MRISIFLVVVVGFQTFALNNYAQTQKLELKLTKATITEVLERIEDKTDFFFFYNNKGLPLENVVSLDLKDKTINEVLDVLFKDTNVSYTINNRQIILIGNEAGSVQQSKTVTGKVTDSSGQPLPGVSVVLKGTTTGTITDGNGNYTLSNVPENAIFQFSFVGMKPMEIAIGGKAQIDVTLSEDAIGIEEVVAVGYGVQKKVNLSGAVASVNMSELTDSRPVTNISNALSGLAAGVSVTSSSNRPGNDDATILVRGQGTLNVSSPLIIIDGVEAAINSVNPQDVESISVLKDAASAAIYGSRAANGVILITTKQGKEGTLKMDYNGYVSFESIRKTLTPVSNYADYMEYMNEGYLNSKLATSFSQGMIDAWRSGTDPLLYPNTNWIDDTFQQSVASNHVFSMSGGSDKIRFYSSFGYLNHPGVMENSGQEKYSARLNIEGDVRPWLKLGANINGYFSDLDVGTDNIESATGVFAYSSATTPGMVFRSPDGRYGAVNNSEDDPQSSNNNPLRNLNSVSGNYGKHNIRSRFFGTLSPFKGFSVTGSFNYDFTDEQLEKIPVFLDGWNFLTNTITLVGGGKTYVTNKDSKVIRHFEDVVARYENKFFNDQLDFGIMAGASQEQYLSKNFSTTRYDLIDPKLTAIDAATGEATSSGSATEWAMRSYFGRMNLSWENKYLLEFNLRSDASSRFLEDKRWGYFPSASAAWRIDQEEFMQVLTDQWLNSLKLRVSYGSLGNNSLHDSNPNLNNYAAQSVFATSNYSWGNAMVVGLAQTALSNAFLTWETTYVTNIGVDFGVMSNRLTGTIDVFNKKTEDILIDLPAPSVHGTSTLPKQNSATVTNKGFELTLGWQDKSGDFSYGINGNFTYAKNTVDKFKGDDYSLSGVNYIREGYSINAQYMLRVDRIIQTDEDLAIVQEMLANNPNAFAAYGIPKKGDLLYKDITGEGIVNSDDREVVSDGNNPKFLFGLNTTFGYKGFDLSVLLQGVAGVEVYWQHHQYNTPTVHYGYQLNKEVVEGRWYEGRTDATYPRLLQYSDTRNTQASDFYLEDKSYLKIRNIQLGYTMPKSITSKLFMDRLRIYGSLENFFTFTSYNGFDPEVNGMAYPSMKQAVIGINLTF
ncbi:MAG TPA: SusC/RagA family TonB-linked outer membrane protein [Prolixibacteraceae bacterium]|nr:SusC/RagA family TonB-linked outer membrane protein [Prolixibacteraceae bacterium]HCR88951.1 SusC/RagA family TonB-linked outer membrane protein [Prolixibacteraceae bacterium]HCU62333.1 SusC/RagA family TonB-linked outer membrane protein [Prolixibacteraceae bacterium]